jgi:hypothetical protein
MAQVPKIDSISPASPMLRKLSSACFQVKGVLAVLPSGIVSTRTAYNDFGGEIVTVAPNPINPSRQRRKGVTTDLNAAGGFNHNLNYENLTASHAGRHVRRHSRQGSTGG